MMEKYIPKLEWVSLIGNTKGEEGEYFKKLIEETKAKIAAVPELGTEEKDPCARLHYFCGATDIYICELNKETGEAFGFSCLGGDRDNAEYGYIDLNEVCSIAMMELDLYFDDTQKMKDIVEKFKS